MKRVGKGIVIDLIEGVGFYSLGQAKREGGGDVFYSFQQT